MSVWELLRGGGGIAGIYRKANYSKSINFDETCSLLIQNNATISSKRILC